MCPCTASTIVKALLQGWSLDDAVREVKGKRPQAHPYLDCWHTMRTRFTEGRTKEVLQTASRLYEERKAVRPWQPLLTHAYKLGRRMPAVQVYAR